VRGTQNLELADSTYVLENFGGLLPHLLFGCFEALHLGFVPLLERASAWSWPRGWLASLAPFGFAPSRCLARVRVKSEPDVPPASPALALFDGVAQGDVPSASESGSSAAHAPSHDRRPAERQEGFSALHA